MTLSSHELGLEALDQSADLDALCLFVGLDERPLRGLAGFVDWRLAGGLSRVLKEKFFEGTEDDWLLVPTSGRFPVPRVFVLGVGLWDALDAADLAHVLGTAAQRLVKAGVKAVGLELPGAPALDEPSRVAAFRSAFLPAFSAGRVAVFGDKSLHKLLGASR